jgi:hypothetical protein
LNGNHAKLQTQKPLARDNDLVVEEFGDELLVYDSKNKRAHSLSATAVSVWRACDGATDIETMSDRLGLTEVEIAHAVDELESLELIGFDGIVVLEAGEPEEKKGITRRQMTMRSVKAGTAVVAAPLVYSINVSPALATLTPIPFQCEVYTVKSCGASTGCGSVAGCCCCCQGGGSCKTCGATAFCDSGKQPCAPVQGGGFGAKCSDAKGTFPADPQGCCGISGADDCGCGFGPLSSTKSGCCTGTTPGTNNCTPGAPNCFPCCRGVKLTSEAQLGCCKSSAVNCCAPSTLTAAQQLCCNRSTASVDCCGPNPPQCCSTGTC